MNGAPTWGGMIMEQTTLVHPSAFCWNPRCSDYGTVNLGNIRRFGRTQAGTHRYQCRTCHGTFVETIGTVFYGRHHRQEMIIWTVKTRFRLAAISFTVWGGLEGPKAP